MHAMNSNANKTGRHFESPRILEFSAGIRLQSREASPAGDMCRNSRPKPLSRGNAAASAARDGMEGHENRMHFPFYALKIKNSILLYRGQSQSCSRWSPLRSTQGEFMFLGMCRAGRLTLRCVNIMVPSSSAPDSALSKSMTVRYICGVDLILSTPCSSRESALRAHASRKYGWKRAYSPTPA